MKKPNWNESVFSLNRKQYRIRSLDCEFYLNCLELAADEDSPGFPCGDCIKVSDQGGRITIDNAQTPEIYGALNLLLAIFFGKEPDAE